MTPLVLLAVIIGLPLLVSIVFRVSSVYLYVSVVAGKLLLTYVGDDAAVALGGLIRNQYSQIFSSLFLLLFPLVITGILLKHSITKSKLVLHFAAYLATFATLYIFVLPTLATGTVGAVINSPIGRPINNFQDIIVAGSALIVLVTMWLTSRGHSAGHHKHYK